LSTPPVDCWAVRGTIPIPATAATSIEKVERLDAGIRCPREMLDAESQL